jgi:phage terminase large subunit-like protein
VAEEPGDECGIVVVSATGERDLYRRTAWVLEDASIKGSPQMWAQRVVEMHYRWGAPIVAETNQGGALVKNAIHQIDPNIPVYEVHSKVGKKLRAEPVVLAYQQGRVLHFGMHEELETQMVTWEPESTRKSPDRVDALVHALTALLIDPPKGFFSGPIRAKGMGQRTINMGGNTALRQRTQRTGPRATGFGSFRIGGGGLGGRGR